MQEELDKLKEFLGTTTEEYGEVSGQQLSIVTAESLLIVKHFRNGQEVVDDRRTVINRCVTDVGVAALMSAASPKNITAFNYHDCGTGGGTGELASQTALATPAGMARATGTMSNPSAKVFQTQTTITFSSSLNISEHGVFDASSGGNMLDRSVFTGISVVNGDLIQFTYQFTMNSGG